MSRFPIRRAAGRALLAAVVAGAGLVTGATVPPASAATVTVGADADARVSASKPKANFGRETWLRTDASPAEETYVRFVVGGASGTVTRAVVRLHVTDGSVDGPAIHRVTGSWNEKSIKWSNRPSRDPAPLSDIGAVAGGGYVEFDVTSAVTGNGTYDFALASVSADNTDFSSREAPANRPQLVVTTADAPPPPPPPPPPPGATTRTFAPTADATVKQESPTGNFGTATTLETDAVPIVESYLKFSVDGITGPVSKAVLRAFVTNGSPNGPAVYRTETGWTEGGIDWSNRAPRTSDPLDDKGAVSANTWVEWDVSAAVGPNQVYSFNLATNANDGTDISSKEAASNRPQLVVTFTSTSGTDTTPPDTAIQSGPTGTLLVDNADFRFTATEGGSSFTCRLDEAATWFDCASPWTQHNLTNGNHTFSVRAEDPAGNTDPTPAEWSFSVNAVNIRQAPLAPPSGAHFGAHVQAGTRDLASVGPAVAAVEGAIDRTLAIDMWYEPWPNVFPTWREQWDLDAGRIPMISWGKWYTDQIARGDHDAYIRARADGIKALGQPVMIRWFWEMDGNRNIDYAISPASYISAWRRIVDIFRAQGATNAAWVWCPNASGFTDNSAQPWYPGDSYVDWLCADGYNFWPERADNRSFEATFAGFYDWARQRPKPIVIGEYGALENPGTDDRAAWIDAARQTVKTKMPRILALAWFHSVHEHDWTLLDEPSALEAFRQMGLDPYFNP
jgi:hypothetical protein